MPKKCSAHAEHSQSIRSLHLRQLFAHDLGRGERFTVEAAGIYLDYSKNRITDETIALLLPLAEECGLRGRIAAMFRGEQINVMEKRAVLHTAHSLKTSGAITRSAITWAPYGAR